MAKTPRARPDPVIPAPTAQVPQVPAPEYKALPVLVAYHSIMRSLCERGMAKDSRNQQQGFNFRGIDQVYAALTPELVRHHCILTVSIVSTEKWTGTTAKGSTMFYTRATVRYTLVSLLDGSNIFWDYIGEGADQGDKSTSKALSMAYKYMAIHAFGIPVSPQSTDDPDATMPEPVSVATAVAAAAGSEPASTGNGIDLEALVDLVSSSKTMEDLQANYANAVRAARNRNQPEWETALTGTKDRRKVAIEAEG